jgi:hypothetical protein
MVDASALDIRRDGLERRQVAMNVRDDSEPHQA